MNEKRTGSVFIPDHPLGRLPGNTELSQRQPRCEHDDQHQWNSSRGIDHPSKSNWRQGRRGCGDNREGDDRCSSDHPIGHPYKYGRRYMRLCYSQGDQRVDGWGDEEGAHTQAQLDSPAESNGPATARIHQGLLELAVAIGQPPSDPRYDERDRHDSRGSDQHAELDGLNVPSRGLQSPQQRSEA